MIYKFIAYGHPNILATHKTTLEFTKDKVLSLKGDCIVGVNADFDLNELKKFIRKSKNNKVAIKIQSSNKKFQETINAQINPKFNSNKELVIRKTDFVSERTFAIKSNKAAFEVNRDLIEFLKVKENRIIIVFKNKQI
ncbi:DUF371 domain-containing protein [Candidatus Woesearchaeota archaeon]|nr:DUF371 domain-containing protein [Candidatus Woesearchaeota archaeon]